MPLLVMWLYCLRQVMAQVVRLENPGFITADTLLHVDQEASPDLTFGVEVFDDTLTLNFGSFIVFQGQPSHGLCLRLCVRALLPQPLGPDCDVVFVDGGNNFDPYAVSDYSVQLGLDPDQVLDRIHICRAFTHHQLACALTDKLPYALKEFKASLVVISDITCLFCDPDVRDDDKEDALQIFNKTTRTLRALARQHHCLILTTNLEQRNHQMQSKLVHAAHVLVDMEQHVGLTRFVVLKHPHLPTHTTIASTPGVRILENYL